MHELGIGKWGLFALFSHPHMSISRAGKATLEMPSGWSHAYACGHHKLLRNVPLQSPKLKQLHQQPQHGGSTQREPPQIGTYPAEVAIHATKSPIPCISPNAGIHPVLILTAKKLSMLVPNAASFQPILSCSLQWFYCCSRLKLHQQWGGRRSGSTEQDKEGSKMGHGSVRGG